MAVSSRLDRRVRARANDLCEYCRLPQSAYPLSFQVDHIIAEQHGGKTQFSNLCLSCPRCNRSKGPNIARIDDRTHDIVSLCNPRREPWADHFRWHGARIIGLTTVGRATVRVLAMDHPDALRLRRELIKEGIFPPGESG